MGVYGWLLVGIWSAGLVHPAFAQPAPACSTEDADAVLASRALVREGFEGVYVCVQDGEALVQFEDRLYRYPVRGMHEVRQLVEEYLGGSVVTVALVPHRLGVPLGTFRFPRMGGRTESAVEARLDVPRRRGPGTALNPSRFKLEVVAHPQLAALFGNVDEPVKLRVSAAPALSASLWRGMSLTGQVVLDLVNEIDGGPKLYPGIIAARQLVRLPGATFATITAGHFTAERYGLDATVQTYMLGGRLMGMARVGRTGFARLEEGTWFYGPVDVTTAQASLGAVVLPQYALTAHVGYGRYLRGDEALTFGLNRRFGEVQMGFQGIVAGDELNLEARIVLPLFMSQHARPQRLRFRTADRFPWAYRYRRVTRIAEDYATAPGAPEVLGPLNPAFFRYLLSREARSEREEFERVRDRSGL
jgi:hypothetical protein